MGSAIGSDGKSNRIELDVIGSDWMKSRSKRWEKSEKEAESRQKIPVRHRFICIHVNNSSGTFGSLMGSVRRANRLCLLFSPLLLYPFFLSPRALFLASSLFFSPRDLHVRWDWSEKEEAMGKMGERRWLDSLSFSCDR